LVPLLRNCDYFFDLSKSKRLQIVFRLSAKTRAASRRLPARGNQSMNRAGMRSLHSARK
jgi:hypothetical protein